MCVISRLDPQPREVVITSHVQVISVECIDGPAMVLTPKHYKKCLVVVTHTLSSGIHLCCSQFKNNKVKPFILTMLCGYPKLKSLLCNGGVYMQSQLEVWMMFRKFETSSSSNQIPQRALTGSKLAQLIGNHLLNLHTDGKTCVQMC